MRLKKKLIWSYLSAATLSNSDNVSMPSQRRDSTGPAHTSLREENILWATGCLVFIKNFESDKYKVTSLISTQFSSGYGVARAELSWYQEFFCNFDEARAEMSWFQESFLCSIDVTRAEQGWY